MKLYFPNFQSEIPGKDVNIQQNIAQCPECKQVCRISDALATQENNSHKENIIIPREIPAIEDRRMTGEYVPGQRPLSFQLEQHTTGHDRCFLLGLPWFSPVSGEPASP